MTKQKTMRRWVALVALAAWLPAPPAAAAGDAKAKKQAKKLEKLAVELKAERKTGGLRLLGVPEGAELKLDGEVLKEAPKEALELKPGQHMVQVLRGKAQPLQLVAVVTKGATVDLDVGAALASLPPPPPEPPPPPPESAVPVLAISTLGVGVAALGAGVLFGVLADGAESEEADARKAAAADGPGRGLVPAM